MNESDSAPFSVVYQPAGESDHELSVRSFAGSLLALSDLFESVDGLVGASDQSVQLTYSVDRPGSLECELILLSVYQGAQPWLFDSANPTPASVIRDLVVGKDGIFSLIQLLGGRYSDGESRIEPGIRVRHTDGREIEIDGDTSKILAENATQELINKVFDPVESNDCQSMVFNVGDNSPVIVNSQNVHLYRPPVPQDQKPQSVETREMKLTLMRVVLEGNSQWQVRDETNNKMIRCRVTDSKFIKLINDGFKFGKGDVIEALVKETMFAASDGGNRRVSYEVTGVLRYRDQNASAWRTLYEDANNRERR